MLGFRIWGLWFGVLGFWGSGLGVLGSWLGFRVRGLGLWVWGFMGLGFLYASLIFEAVAQGRAWGSASYAIEAVLGVLRVSVEP